MPARERRLGVALAAQLAREKAILGVFDEGCMGMFNAIIPDHLLNPVGVSDIDGKMSRSSSYHLYDIWQHFSIYIF